VNIGTHACYDPADENEEKQVKIYYFKRKEVNTGTPAHALIYPLT
jgi:hypothetical protein